VPAQQIVAIWYPNTWFRKAGNAFRKSNTSRQQSSWHHSSRIA